LKSCSLTMSVEDQSYSISVVHPHLNTKDITQAINVDSDLQICDLSDSKCTITLDSKEVPVVELKSPNTCRIDSILTIGIYS
jgi:hypothetical protein